MTKSKTREQAIEDIEMLYPADSIDIQTAKIGEGLLSQARNKAQDWRCEPTEVLIRYAKLCLDIQENIVQQSEPTKPLIKYAKMCLGTNE